MIEFHYPVPGLQGWIYFGANSISYETGFYFKGKWDGNCVDVKYNGFTPKTTHDEIIEETCLSENVRPIMLESSQLSVLEKPLSNPRCIIWTGSGLSRLSGIPTGKELEDSLYIHQPLELYKKLVEEPYVLAKNFSKFVKSLNIAEPVSLHTALHKWKTGNREVWTENLDKLHENVGTKILRRTEIDDSFCSREKPTVIVTLGLRENPRGLLTKLFNLGVEIFAVLNEPPEYRVSAWCCENLGENNLERLLCKTTLTSYQ